MIDTKSIGLVFAIPAMAAVICAGLIIALRPLLQRYALVRPNARSSHKAATPQGGGIAIVFAITITIVTAGRVASLSSFAIAAVLAAAFFLAAIGMFDDLQPIPVGPRLALQLAAVSFLIATLPSEIRILVAIPVSLERALLIMGLLWFVNLVNFMDGLDWMTVAEMLPMTIALAAFAYFGEAPADVLPVASALAGALLGFAPFNKPVAKLFLGDVGSLPIGLLTGWCLIELASTQRLAAALLLPLYYIADATITLFRRLAKGERFWDAHRSHFYQRATDNGLSVPQIVTSVFLLNIVLAALATVSIIIPSPGVIVCVLILGAAAVTAALVRFSRASTLLG